MREGDVAGVRERLQAALAECDSGARDLVISNEALFGRWDEIPAPVREVIAELARTNRVEWWLWLREPISYARSQYIQALKNRRRGAGLGHGEDQSIEEMLETPWFRRRLDYVGYLREIEQLLGRGAVRLFPYGEDTVRTFCAAIGLEAPPPALVRRNEVLGEWGVGMLRRLNRADVSGIRRRVAIALIERLDAEMSGSRPLTLSGEAQGRIRELTAPGLEVLASEFGVVFSIPRP